MSPLPNVITAKTPIDQPLPSRQNLAAKLDCPFVALSNPHLSRAEESSKDWLSKYYGQSQIAARSFRSGMSQMMSGFYPYADQEALSLSTDYLSWAFMLDDIADESEIGMGASSLAKLLDGFDQILGGASLASDASPSEKALEDIAKRVKVRWGEDGLEEFRLHNSTYFGAMIWEANNRANSWIPDYPSYAAFRPAAGAVPPFFWLAERANEISLTQNLDQYAKLSSLAGRIICWYNDILSFEKEKARGDLHNLGIVLEYHSQLSVAEALQEAINISNGEVREFSKLAKLLRQQELQLHSAEERYLSILESIMATTLNWTLNSMRYANEA